MTTDLFTQLSDGDPAKGLRGYDDADVTTMVRAITEDAPDGVSMRPIATRRIKPRRLLVALPVAAAVVAVLAFSVIGWPRSLTGNGSIGEVGVGPADDWTHPSASDPVFDGLPPAVVSEVLANPTAQANADMPISAATRKWMWQGEVVNFVLCRQVLDVFTEWHATGVARPSLLKPPVPTNMQPSYKQLLSDYQFYRSAIQTGHIKSLVDALMLDGTCGSWVPAKPGDVGGPVVNDVVRATLGQG